MKLIIRSNRTAAAETYANWHKTGCEQTGIKPVWVMTQTTVSDNAAGKTVDCYIGNILISLPVLGCRFHNLSSSAVAICFLTQFFGVLLTVCVYTVTC